MAPNQFCLFISTELPTNRLSNSPTYRRLKSSRDVTYPRLLVKIRFVHADWNCSRIPRALSSVEQCMSACFSSFIMFNRSVLKLNDFSHVTSSFCKFMFRKNNYIIGFECRVLTIERRILFSGRSTLVNSAVFSDKNFCSIFSGDFLSSATQVISDSLRVLRTFLIS